MRSVLAALLVFIALARPAWADTYTPYADLVCDPAKNIALARFIYTEDDPPHYARLPAGVDDELSAQAGTGRRVCTLANGWEIKLRNGEAQAFDTMGGLDPPAFFSLWANHRKIFSKQNWSEQNYSQSEPQIGVVLTPTQVTTCAWTNGMEHPLSCVTKPLDLDQYEIDTVEYPANGRRGPTPAELVVNPAEQVLTTAKGLFGNPCWDIIRHGPNNAGIVRDRAGEPDIPVADKDLDWIDEEARAPDFPWSFVQSLRNVFGIARGDLYTGGVSFASSAVDFDGDGKPDSVIERESQNNYLDGSYFVVAPADIPVIDVLRALYSGPEDVEKDIQHAEALGWHVYSGGRPGLYPELSPRYVHIDRIGLGGDYLLALSGHDNVDPTATVIKPKPDGTFDTVCTIQRPHLNY